jgi:hypothetical protein
MRSFIIGTFVQNEVTTDFVLSKEHSSADRSVSANRAIPV